MAAAHDTFGYGNPAHECDGAQIRAHSRRLATVVSVAGKIEGRNFDRVAARVSRFVLEDTDFILDLDQLTAISAECRSLVYVVERACHASGVEWVLVAADDVVDLFELDDDLSCAGARSVPEALRYFADATRARRRLLLPMLGRTA